MLVGWVMKHIRRDKSEHALMMELPSYRVPKLRDVAIGLYERGMIFLRRLTGVLLGLTVLMWFRSEEHKSELQSLMRISYAVFCLTQTTNQTTTKLKQETTVDN